MINNKIIIYTLTDPLTNEIKYVGKTSKNLEERLISHINDSKYRKKLNERLSWIKSLHNKGLTPVIEMLEIVNEEYSNEIEIFWISQFKAWGFKLKNATEGGDGGKLTQKTKDKISLNSTGIKRSIETRKKISNSKKGTMTGNKNPMYGTHTTSKSIIQMTKNNEFIKEWPSALKAAIVLHINSTNISRVCTGERKSTGGFKWCFK